MPILEIVKCTRVFRRAVAPSATADELQQICSAMGCKTLAEQAMIKAASGHISIEDASGLSSGWDETLFSAMAQPTTLPAPEHSPALATTGASRVPKAGPPSAWKAMRFELRYRNRQREVIVLAPLPEFARDGTGAAADEVVSSNPLDSGSESLTRMLCAKRASSAELETFFTEMERCLRTKIPESTALRLVTPLCTTP